MKTIKQNAKPNYSFRLDPRLIKKARDAGLNLAPLFESIIETTLSVNRCPVCGNLKKAGTK